MKWHETTSPYRGERSVGTGSTVVERKGYRVRTRGDTTGTIEHEYECPVHGRFRAMVPRVDVPDAVVCGREVGIPGFVECTDVAGCGPADGHRHLVNVLCGSSSRWVPPLVGIGVESGMVTS